jgi:hypothetical protein
MIDPSLERQYADCRELMDLWRQYHDFFKIAVAGQDLTPEREHEFITIKSRIAMLHDTFMDCLEHDQNIGQNILSIVTRSITMKHVHRMSTAEIKKIELEWHESYLLLNETIGVLEDKRRQFADITPSQYYRKQATKKASNSIMTFLTSWVFKLLVAIVVLEVAVFAFIKAGGVDLVERYPLTRNLLIRFEGLIQLVYRDYPFRDLSALERRSAMASTKVRQVDAAPGQDAETGIAAVRQRMGSSPHNFASDLENYQKPDYGMNGFRVETYRGDYLYGGGDTQLYLYLMPDTSTAKNIESKYNAWKTERGPDAEQDWLMFRRANVIGIAVGGDREGTTRKWIEGEYTGRAFDMD